MCTVIGIWIYSNTGEPKYIQINFTVNKRCLACIILTIVANINYQLQDLLIIPICGLLPVSHDDYCTFKTLVKL